MALSIAQQRTQRRILEGAAVASVLSGAPSVATTLARGSARSAVDYAIAATRAVGTIAPSGRPGFVRGATIHGVISIVAGELLGFALPREDSVLWGAFGGLLLGVVNVGVIACRCYPMIAERDLAQGRCQEPDPRPHPRPNDFPDVDTLQQHLLAFGRRYEQIAQPFPVEVTRTDRDRVAQRLDLPASKAA